MTKTQTRSRTKARTSRTRKASPAGAHRDVYADVTAKITARLEQGSIPWQKPWRSSGLLPTSIATGRPYRGINLFLLSLEAQAQGYSSPYWLTFHQAQERGGNVRKGEKGTLVVLYRRTEVHDNDADPGNTDPEATRSLFLLRHFYVFNLEQTENVELPKRFDLPDFEPIEPGEAIQQVVDEYHNRPSIENVRGDRCYYVPDTDEIRTPGLDQFSTPAAYAESLFHELTHSTGHEKRLDRFTKTGEPQHFGTERYAREELVAEMGAAMLAAAVGLDLDYDNHTAYIQNWLKALNNDTKLVVQAAGQAQRAVDHIRGTTFEEDPR